MTSQIRNFSLENCSAILEPMVLVQEQSPIDTKNNYWESRF